MNNSERSSNYVFPASGGGEQNLVQHYLYLPTEEAASKVAIQLRSQGFETQERLSADGENWLVVAQHHIVPSAEFITRVREAMEHLADQFQGEYDGWEVAVQ